MDLSSVVDALLEDARADGAKLVADARAEVDADLAAARAAAREESARARREGTAEAEAQLAVERALSRREARECVLAARREVWEELRRRARAASVALRESPEYADLLARLSALAREQLGSDARLRVEPDGAAGLVAESGERLVDYRLEAVAERFLHELGDDVEELWR